MQTSAMFLAGTKKIFFLEAQCCVLTTIVVVTHWCFSCCRAELTQSQRLSCFSCCPSCNQAGGAPGAGGGTQPGQLARTIQRDVPYHRREAQQWNWGKEGGRGARLEWWHLSSRETIRCDEHHFPGGDWMSACPWEVGNEFAVVLCFFLGSFCFN